MRQELLTQELQALAKAIEVEISTEQADQMVEHLLWVIDTNSRINLTAIKDPRAGLRLQILDSLAVLPELMASCGTVLDLGTGGGYPGIPLGIVSGRQLVLLDATAKKARELESFVQHAGLGNIVVAAARAEEHALAQAQYGAVIARAVAALPALVELASPLLRQNGRLLSLKGDLTEDELQRGDRAAVQVGMSRVGLRRYSLPDGEIRSVVTYERVAGTTLKLPRRAGMAQHQPLA